MKDLARRLNYREDEFGELHVRITKAEARRRFVRHATIRLMAERDVIDAACKRAHDEICAAMDAEVFREIELTIGG